MVNDLLTKMIGKILFIQDPFNYLVLLPSYGSNSDVYDCFFQPLLYGGRGPGPAGMAMMPMLLPDGRIGYVL